MPAAIEQKVTLEGSDDAPCASIVLSCKRNCVHVQAIARAILH